MKHAAAFLVFWLVLWWTWQLFVGEWNGTEWIAGAIAATVGAALGALATARAGAHAHPPWAIVRDLPVALGMVVVDFATVLRDVALRRDGVFRETKFRHPDDEAHRAWAMVVAGYSPNAYVVDIGDGESTTHHLTRRDASQRPA